VSTAIQEGVSTSRSLQQHRIFSQHQQLGPNPHAQLLMKRIIFLWLETD
jgi:hypothetical protein